MNKEESKLKDRLTSPLDEMAKEAKFEEFPPFLQNVVKKYKIKYNTVPGIFLIIHILELGLLLNYVSTTQFLIVKRYLENNKNRTVLDEEVYIFIKNNKDSFLNRWKKFPIDPLTVEDRSQIYQDFHMIYELNRRKAFHNATKKEVLDRIVSSVSSYDLDIFRGVDSCFRNILLRKELDEIGLQDYVAEQVPRILQKKPADEEEKELLEDWRRTPQTFEDRTHWAEQILKTMDEQKPPKDDNNTENKNTI